MVHICRNRARALVPAWFPYLERSSMSSEAPDYHERKSKLTDTLNFCFDSAAVFLRKMFHVENSLSPCFYLVHVVVFEFF